MLAPLGLRFGSLRPAPASSHLPMSEEKMPPRRASGLLPPKGAFFALGRPGGKEYPHAAPAACCPQKGRVH
ncbi:hypothetical protein GCM10008164_34190 [Achromobacter xylosoxidans]|nr:hypothetical protein GCM10008164_34190 [Achromobacter xylosoxidans]